MSQTTWTFVPRLQGLEANVDQLDMHLFGRLSHCHDLGVVESIDDGLDQLKFLAYMDKTAPSDGKTYVLHRFTVNEELNVIVNVTFSDGGSVYLRFVLHSAPGGAPEEQSWIIDFYHSAVDGVDAPRSPSSKHMAQIMECLLVFKPFTRLLDGALEPEEDVKVERMITQSRLQFKQMIEQQFHQMQHQHHH